MIDLLNPGKHKKRSVEISYQKCRHIKFYENLYLKNNSISVVLKLLETEHAVEKLPIIELQ